jgi:hypothetical protein
MKTDNLMAKNEARKRNLNKRKRKGKEKETNGDQYQSDMRDS